MTDDDLIAEVSRRLAAGRFGFHGLMSPVQADHRDNWHALLETVYDCCNRYPHEMSALLIRARARELQDADAPTTEVYAVNTTFYGRQVSDENRPR